jgi:hypothetical protein
MADARRLTHVLAGAQAQESVQRNRHASRSTARLGETSPFVAPRGRARRHCTAPKGYVLDELTSSPATTPQVPPADSSSQRRPPRRIGGTPPLVGATWVARDSIARHRRGTILDEPTFTPATKPQICPESSSSQKLRKESHRLAFAFAFALRGTRHAARGSLRACGRTCLSDGLPTTAASTIVTDIIVETGNRAHATLASRSSNVKRPSESYRNPPLMLSTPRRLTPQRLTRSQRERHTNGNRGK